MPQNVLLGVNIDHVATLREARHTRYPDPLLAALLAEQGGADSITVHLREDRRHIQPRDVEKLQNTIQTRLNLEIAVDEERLALAEQVRPHSVCFVPEKREELTTEGGLNLLYHQALIAEACQRLDALQIQVSLFIEPDEAQIRMAHQIGASCIELHTGGYANATGAQQVQWLEQLAAAAELAHQLGLIVNAGHGLTLRNVQPIARMPYMHELNIGHSVIADAIFVGLPTAVTRMKQVIKTA